MSERTGLSTFAYSSPICFSTALTSEMKVKVPRPNSAALVMK